MVRQSNDTRTMENKQIILSVAAMFLMLAMAAPATAAPPAPGLFDDAP